MGIRLSRRKEGEAMGSSSSNRDGRSSSSNGRGLSWFWFAVGGWRSCRVGGDETPQFSMLNVACQTGSPGSTNYDLV